MSVKTALPLALCYLLASQALAEVPGKAIYPRLQNLTNRQQEALRREQQSYRDLLSMPSHGQEGGRLEQELKRQNVRQRQLQYRQRNKAITEQQRTLRLPEGLVRDRNDSNLRRFRREQEAQRLRLKIQRRSWPVQ
jgi:hypothetical protein